MIAAKVTEKGFGNFELKNEADSIAGKILSFHRLSLCMYVRVSANGIMNSTYSV